MSCKTCERMLEMLTRALIKEDLCPYPEIAACKKSRTCLSCRRKYIKMLKAEIMEAENGVIYD